MKICVPFKYWQAALHCAAVDDIRYYLNGIHLNKNKIESTNGHVAYQATFGYWEQDGFNYLNGQCGFVDKHECNGEWPDIIIGGIGAKPSRAIQKKTIWLIIEKPEEDSNELIIKYLDNCSQTIYIQPAEKVDGRFPAFEKILPKGKVNKDQFNIGFRPEYLALPQKLLEGERDWNGSVRMKAWDSSSFATFELLRVARECESEVLIVAPLRL